MSQCLPLPSSSSATLASAVILVLSQIFLAGCAGSSAPGLEGMPDGINDHFLSEDLDVDEYVGKFEGESREVYAKRAEIVAALGLSPGDHVADIGAGTGFFSALFNEAVGDEGGVYAVEISPNFLEHLRAFAKNESLDQLQVVKGTEKSVALEADSVNLAFICDVYHHFEYPPETLASLMSAIRPGGSLVIVDFKRIPGESAEWLLKHIRAGREVFTKEIETAGFIYEGDLLVEGVEDNYILWFKRPD